MTHSPTIIAITESSDTLRVRLCSMGDIRYTPVSHAGTPADRQVASSKGQPQTHAPLLTTVQQ